MKPTLEELAARHAAARLNKKRRNADLRRHGYDPDGADGQRYRDLFFAAIGPPRSVALWRFPSEDFAAWKAECYAAYLAEVAATASDAEARGLRVADLLAALAERGWENTSENRARIVGGERGLTLGLKIGGGHVGSALVADSAGIDSAEEPLAEGEAHAAAARRILDRGEEFAS